MSSGWVPLRVLGGIAAAALLLASTPAAAQDGAGRALYDKYCSQCHGDDGAGRGVAAPYMLPAPRDFTSGKYQVRSTPTGSLPTDEDIARVIREGMPNTAMPAFSNLRRREVEALVELLKTFSPRFAVEEPDEPLRVPRDPGFNEDNIESARVLYEQTGCAGCHGVLGRGDGPSAPSLRDDWGQFVRAADLTRPWTFNGGATRRDIYRSIATGLNGTPMAGFAGALSEEQLWQLVDFVSALSGQATQPGFANVLVARWAEGELDLERGAELFAEAAPALFPVFGQVIQPGRAFHPGVLAIEARAVYTQTEIAFMVSWHDIVADTAGRNAPDLPRPVVEDLLLPRPSQPGAEADPFADEVADPFADAVADPFADVADDPWAEEETMPAVIVASEWSDAVALQLPRRLPDGVRRPYFVFGDAANPVELWYVDLAEPETGQLWIGRGSDNLVRADEPPPEVRASFEAGRWSVVFKRRRASREGISFPEDTFVPIAFTVWDGFHEERGNKRGLTSWYHVYVPPVEQTTPWRMMAQVALGIVVLELGVIFWARRRRRTAATLATEPTASGAASP
jgi:mono/diheme cytochrome c family protein